MHSTNDLAKRKQRRKAPLVSIVLPTHNGGRYINQSIQSVIQQTWEDWKLIVVNDASNDDTPAIIERWAAKRPANYNDTFG